MSCDPEQIRLTKTRRKLAHQRLRPREAMRLERDEQAARAETLESLQRRLNLSRVMTVVIEHAESRITENLLLPPRRTGEIRNG